MATDPTNPLPDIEAAIKEEVDGINRTRRPPVRFAKPIEEAPPQPEPTGVSLTLGQTAAVEQAPPEPVPLPVILAALGGAIDELDRRVDARLTRIERALGITP